MNALDLPTAPHHYHSNPSKPKNSSEPHPLPFSGKKIMDLHMKKFFLSQGHIFSKSALKDFS